MPCSYQYDKYSQELLLRILKNALHYDKNSFSLSTTVNFVDDHS